MFYTNTYAHVWVHKCTCIVFKRGTVWTNNALYFSYYVRHAITARLPLNLLTLNRLNGCRVEPILSAIDSIVDSGPVERLISQSRSQSGWQQQQEQKQQDAMVSERSLTQEPWERCSHYKAEERLLLPTTMKIAWTSNGREGDRDEKKRKKLTVGDDTLGWGEGRCLNCILGTKSRKKRDRPLVSEVRGTQERWGSFERYIWARYEF